MEQQQHSRLSGQTDANRSPTTSIRSSIQVTALDAIVNVNSLFTIAVFIGLSLASPGQQSLGGSACDASINVAKNLLIYEVISFSFFLFSSLIAQGLKLAINLRNSEDADEAFRVPMDNMDKHVLRSGMLASAVGSVIGCVFLVLSMVNMVQIRLGTLSCGSQAAFKAVCTLIIVVASGLLVYISTTMYAFLR